MAAKTYYHEIGHAVGPTLIDRKDVVDLIVVDEGVGVIPLGHADCVADGLAADLAFSPVASEGHSVDDAIEATGFMALTITAFGLPRTIMECLVLMKVGIEPELRSITANAKGMGAFHSDLPPSSNRIPPLLRSAHAPKACAIT